MLNWKTYKLIEESCWRTDMDTMINEKNNILWIMYDVRNLRYHNLSPELHDHIPTEYDNKKLHHGNHWVSVQYLTHEDAVKAYVKDYDEKIFKEIFGE